MAPAKKPKGKHKSKLKLTDKAQSERFIEAARTEGTKTTGAAFEEAFKKVVPPRQHPKPPEH